MIDIIKIIFLISLWVICSQICDKLDTIEKLIRIEKEIKYEVPEVRGKDEASRI